MHVPPGFSIVTPYLVVPDAGRYVAFLEAALGACEIGRSIGPDGSIANAQLRFGDATIMLSDAKPEWPAGQTSLYLYVEDADAAMARALAAGAEEVMPVGDQPYGDRQGGVRDPAGNIWWLAQRLSDAPYF